jgi:hypothetical protein
LGTTASCTQIDDLRDTSLSPLVALSIVNSDMESSQDPARTTLCDEEKFKDFSDVDSDDTPSLVLHPSRSRFFRPIVITLSAILVLIPLVYFTIYAPRRGLKYDQCGTTADEARARGCVFEITGFTWLPKACQDTETEDEFLTYLAANELNIYRDANYTEIVSIEEVRLGNGPGCKPFQSPDKGLSIANPYQSSCANSTT